jgi:hypothetical protein
VVQQEQSKPDAVVVIPYVPNLSEKIIRFWRRTTIRVVCKSGDTLSTRFMNFELKEPDNYKEVVYSILCQCGKECIGETARPLSIGVKEHQTALKKGETTTSKLAEHTWNINNIFEFDRAKPIGRERLWKPKKCHEAMEIYLSGQNVVSAPSMDLDPVWFSTLNELKVVRNKKMNTATTNTLRRPVRIRERLSLDDLKTTDSPVA